MTRGETSSHVHIELVSPRRHKLTFNAQTVTQSKCWYPGIMLTWQLPGYILALWWTCLVFIPAFLQILRQLKGFYFSWLRDALSGYVRTCMPVQLSLLGESLPPVCPSHLCSRLTNTYPSLARFPQWTPCGCCWVVQLLFHRLRLQQTTAIHILSEWWALILFLSQWKTTNDATFSRLGKVGIGGLQHILLRKNATSHSVSYDNLC